MTKTIRKQTGEKEMKTINIQKQKQFWCKLFLGVMTFILPFINLQAWANLPEVQKLSTLLPYEDYVDISKDLAVWATSTPDIGGIQIFAYDFLNNNYQEIQLTNAPGVLNSSPTVSGNLVLYSSSIWNAIDHRYNFTLNICEYNSQQGVCSHTYVIDRNAVSNYYFIQINEHKITWQGLDAETGHSAIFACEFDFTEDCKNKTNVQDLFDGTENRNAALDIDEGYLVYKQSNSNSIYLYDFATKQKPLLLSLPVLTSGGYYGSLYMDGNKIAWEEVGNEVYVHHCQLDLQSATDKCVNHKRIQTASHKGMVRGISGDNIAFIETVDSGNSSGFLRKVKVLNLVSGAETELFSSNLPLQRAALQDNKVIWLTSNVAMANNPDPGVYSYDLANLPGNTPPSVNHDPTVSIISLQQIQKLMWDHGFVIKFEVAGHDDDGDTLTFTHPLANELPGVGNYKAKLNPTSDPNRKEFSWGPSFDMVAGLNWNTQTVGSGINWTSTGNFSSGGINWTDVVDIYTPFAVSDTQSSASTQAHLQPVYKPAHGNGFCDNGLKGYVKTELANAYPTATSGINWDIGIPWQYGQKFYDIGENMNDNTYAPKDCTQSVCGNGVSYDNRGVEPGEQCDDGNTSQTDSCLNNCQLARCGDGIRKITTPFEVCDDGNTSNNDACTNTCVNARCGDGFIRTGVESCDDGNTVSGDGCSSNCIIEITLSVCGDRVVQSPNSQGVLEQCDDGNINNNDGCSSTCKIEKCGDGIKQTNEQCDDGNVINDDGCSSSCVIEAPIFKGKVVDNATGLGIAGVKVTLDGRRSDNVDLHLTVLSDASGNFKFKNVGNPNTYYHMTFVEQKMSKNYSFTAVNVTNTTPVLNVNGVPSTSGYQTPAVPGTKKIIGYVKTASGAPVKDVVVKADEQSGYSVILKVITDSNGYFEFENLPSGIYQVNATPLASYNSAPYSYVNLSQVPGPWDTGTYIKK